MLRLRGHSLYLVYISPLYLVLVSPGQAIEVALELLLPMELAEGEASGQLTMICKESNYILISN